jgi:hypothetical protein
VLNGNNNIPFQFVQEIQVKSNGFEAEYGGATGGVVNVVTKTGGNQFHGEASLAFEANKLSAGPRRILTTTNVVGGRYIFPRRDNFLNTFPSLNLSGPILKDRLYFFTSFTPQFFNNRRTVQFADNSSNLLSLTFEATTASPVWTERSRINCASTARIHTTRFDSTV